MESRFSYFIWQIWFDLDNLVYSRPIQFVEFGLARCNLYVSECVCKMASKDMSSMNSD